MLSAFYRLASRYRVGDIPLVKTCQAPGRGAAWFVRGAGGLAPLAGETQSTIAVLGAAEPISRTIAAVRVALLRERPTA